MPGLSRQISRINLLSLRRILAVLFLAASVSIASPCRATGTRRLIVEQGIALVVFYQKHFVELKRTSPSDGTLQGSGWLDPAKTKVFVAYPLAGSGEPYSLFDIIDLQQQRIIHLDTMESVPTAGSDTSFAVNSARGEVLFNRNNGVSLLKIDTAKNIYRIYSVNEFSCQLPFWIDDHTGGCMVNNERTDNFQLVTFPIPPVSQLHSEPPPPPGSPRFSYPIKLKWTSAHWTVDKMLRLQELPKTAPRD